MKMLSAVNSHGDRMGTMYKLVAVAIDKDKGSQSAMKWAVDYVLSKGQTVLLIHVRLRSSSAGSSQRLSQISNVNDETGSVSGEYESQTSRDLFLPFHCFCARKDIQCQEVVLDDSDVAKALVQYITESAVEVFGSWCWLKRRFKAKDIPGNVSKGVPDFCTVYVIPKGKISSTRAASRPAPISAPLRNQILHQASSKSEEIAIPNAFNSKVRDLRMIAKLEVEVKDLRRQLRDMEIKLKIFVRDRDMYARQVLWDCEDLKKAVQREFPDAVGPQEAMDKFIEDFDRCVEVVKKNDINWH